MAIVRHLEVHQLEGESRHTETECTYSIVNASDGATYLQIDTYGSPYRKVRGKKSQPLRFSAEAVSQLKEILQRHFPE